MIITNHYYKSKYRIKYSNEMNLCKYLYTSSNLHRKYNINISIFTRGYIYCILIL